MGTIGVVKPRVVLAARFRRHEESPASRTHLGLPRPLVGDSPDAEERPWAAAVADDHGQASVGRTAA